jgi:hypothetical protein
MLKAVDIKYHCGLAVPVHDCCYFMADAVTIQHVTVTYLKDGKGKICEKFSPALCDILVLSIIQA